MVDELRIEMADAQVEIMDALKEVTQKATANDKALFEVCKSLVDKVLLMETRIEALEIKVSYLGKALERTDQNLQERVSLLETQFDLSRLHKEID